MRRSYRWVASGVLSLLGLAACASEPLAEAELGDPGPSAGTGGNAEADGGGDSGGGSLANGGNAHAGTGGRGMCSVDKGGEGGDLGTTAGLTNRVPALPFLLQAYEDPTEGFCINVHHDSCPLGPWTLELEPGDGGGFDGVLVALDGSIAETLRLEPEGDHYRFARTGTTLAEYTYAWWVTDGVWVDELTQMQLIDETGDCVADRVKLSGLASTVGLISADFGGDPETYPIDIEGESLDPAPAALDPTTNDDPLHPILRTPELLASGTATLTDAQGQVLDAEPLTVGRFIYGFRAVAALDADSHATWNLHGKALAGRSRDREVAAAFRDWPLITDGTLVLPGGGSRASFRLTQPPGTKRLRFVASAKPVSDPDPHHPLHNAEYGIVVEYAVPDGPVIGAALSATATSCADYPDFCNPDGDPNNPAGPGVFDFSLDVPESSEPREVLLRLLNHNFDYGVQGMPILVDDLHFE